MVATICEARAASSSQLSGELDAASMRSALMPDDAAAPTALLRPRSSGHPHRRLGLDDLSGAPVFLGQPPVTEV